MLAFFRRVLSSWLAVGLLALIMIAFIITGVGTPGGGLVGGPGADAVATVEQKANELLAQVDAYRDLSSSLAVEETSSGDL